MRYVLMTYSAPDHVEAWERSTPAEKQLEIDRVLAWFREHGAAGRIVGGEELGGARDGQDRAAVGRQRRPVHRDQGVAGRVHRRSTCLTRRRRSRSRRPGRHWTGRTTPSRSDPSAIRRQRQPASVVRAEFSEPGSPPHRCRIRRPLASPSTSPRSGAWLASADLRPGVRRVAAVSPGPAPNLCQTNLR